MNWSEALRANNANRGAGYIERNGQQLLVRSPGQLTTIGDIEQVVIANRDGRPVKVADVAEVAIGKELRTGAATRDGKETVMGTAMMLVGENSRAVAQAVAEKLETIQPSLPDGVKVEAVYDRTRLVDKAIATVEKNLLEGALLVIVVLFLLLGNLRAALITAAVIPLVDACHYHRHGAGWRIRQLDEPGCAGLRPDRRWRGHHCRELYPAPVPGPAPRSVAPCKERLQLVFEATNEVIRPSLFGVAIITVVYLPIFCPHRGRGQDVPPHGGHRRNGTAAAMVLSLTVVPAAVAVFMTGKISEKESPVISGAKSLYRPALLVAMRFRWLVLGGATALVASLSLAGDHPGVGIYSTTG